MVGQQPIQLCSKAEAQGGKAGQRSAVDAVDVYVVYIYVAAHERA